MPWKQLSIAVNASKKVLHHFCDVAPLTFEPWSISEHSAARIVGLCALPLLAQATQSKNSIIIHEEAYEALGARLVSGSSDFREYTFYLNPNFKWEDQTTVSGYDYARGINKLVQGKNNRFRKLLADVVEIIAYDDRLTFKLKNANRLFPLLFTFPALSPTHESSHNLYPGAYKISTKIFQGNNLEKLTLRAQWPLKPHDVEYITFDFGRTYEKGRDDFGIERFKSNNFDLTWDTFFPYDLRDSLHEHIQESDPNIFVLLSALDCLDNNSIDVLKKITPLIDRDDLVNFCSNTPTSIYGFSPNPVPQSYRAPEYYALKKESFSIGYEDFYPNAHIANRLAYQLKKYGFDVETKILGYGVRERSTDLRLELIHNPFNDPILLYRNELTKKIFFDRHPTLWKNYLQLFSQYVVADSSDRKKITNKLDDILLQRGDFLALLKLPGFRLKHPRVGEASYKSGKLWQWSQTLT